MRAFVQNSGLMRPVGVGSYGKGDAALGKFAGLGLVNSMWCDSFEQAIETLGEVVRRADAENVREAAYAQAKSVLTSETSWNIFGRTTVNALVNCEAQTARIAVVIQQLNVKLKSPVTIPPSVLAQLKDANESALPTEPMPLWTKVAIVGGISVAGLIAVAVITGQVAPLLRTVKKVL